MFSKTNSRRLISLSNVYNMNSQQRIKDKTIGISKTAHILPCLKVILCTWIWISHMYSDMCSNWNFVTFSILLSYLLCLHSCVSILSTTATCFHLQTCMCVYKTPTKTETFDESIMCSSSTFFTSHMGSEETLKI